MNQANPLLPERRPPLNGDQREEVAKLCERAGVDPANYIANDIPANEVFADLAPLALLDESDPVDRRVDSLLLYTALLAPFVSMIANHMDSRKMLGLPEIVPQYSSGWGLGALAVSLHSLGTTLGMRDR